MLAMILTITTIFAGVSRNTRTTETMIDHVGAISTVLAWIRTAFVDFYNTTFPSENMTVHIFSIGVTLLYSQLM